MYLLDRSFSVFNGVKFWCIYLKKVSVYSLERSLRVINGKRFQCNQWKEVYV